MVYTAPVSPMNDIRSRSRLSQESITILSVGGVLLGTAVALGALILTTTERIEYRIVRVEDRLLAVEKETALLRVGIERVEDRLLAVEKETTALRVEIERVVERLSAVENETASLRVDVTEVSARLGRLEAAATTGADASTG